MDQDRTIVETARRYIETGATPPFEEAKRLTALASVLLDEIDEGVKTPRGHALLFHVAAEPTSSAGALHTAYCDVSECGFRSDATEQVANAVRELAVHMAGEHELDIWYPRS